METTKPVIALNADEYARGLSKQTVLFGFALNFLIFFENDFECDENQNYIRMNAYIEAAEWMEANDFLRPTPYRERMIRRVKERIAEVKI